MSRPAPWDEINVESGEWHVPAVRMKDQFATITEPN